MALGLGLSEWLRGSVLTGFPWNALGMALGGTLVTAQAASLVGLDGLTILAIAAVRRAGDADRRGRRATVLDADAVAHSARGILLVGFGAARLAQPPPATVPHVVVRIMQPGLRPDEKFSPANKDEILARYFDLSRRTTPRAASSLMT